MQYRESIMSDLFSSNYDMIKKYIDEYDYFGLLEECCAPKDEFDNYSRELAERISDENSVEEIAAMIANIMDPSFGEPVGPEKFIETAKKIHAGLHG